jgi:tight adherence protein B
MRWRTATIPAFLTLLLPASAGAAQLSISPAGNPIFPNRAYVLQMDSPAALKEADVEVRENGRPVKGVRVSSAAAGTAGEFASVLVVDSSLSMKGKAIREAMTAARAFAAHRAPNQELGAITFSGHHRLLLPLSTNEGEIEEALATTPRLGGGTHLYDAVSAAVSLLENEGVAAGSIVVLSDGTDTGSHASEQQVLSRAAEAGVRIFVVGLESGDFDAAPLRTLAQAGEYTAATEPQQLAPIFSRFGAERASEHLLRYRSQAGIAEHVAVAVRIKGVPGTTVTSYESPGGAPEIPNRSRPTTVGFWGSGSAMLMVVLLIGLFLSVAVFAAIRPSRESVVERLARLGVIDARSSVVGSEDGGSEARPAGYLARFERRLSAHERWQRFAERLELAAIRLPALQILAGTIVATVLMTLLIAAAAPFSLMALLALLIPFGVRAVIRRRVQQVRQAFAEDLADNLQVIASAIRSGHSLVGALAVVAEESTGPAQIEFRRIVATERVGVPLEDAIRESAQRMESRDMEQLALVAIIQRETGGNTAEILDQAVRTIRERTELRRMVSSLTAQGRLSRAIVTALPLFLVVALSVLNPGYIAPLFNTTGGQILSAIGVAMVVAGSLLIKRIVDIRV